MSHIDCTQCNKTQDAWHLLHTRFSIGEESLSIKKYYLVWLANSDVGRPVDDQRESCLASFRPSVLNNEFCYGVYVEVRMYLGEPKRFL
jgi:hypothetical protein